MYDELSNGPFTKIHTIMMTTVENTRKAEKEENIYQLVLTEKLEELGISTHMGIKKDIRHTRVLLPPTSSPPK